MKNKNQHKLHWLKDLNWILWNKYNSCKRKNYIFE